MREHSGGDEHFNVVDKVDFDPQHRATGDLSRPIFTLACGS